MYSTSISESYNKNEDHSRKQVIVLAGATSAGKSAVALELTKVFDSEIVIGDSVQVYKHADIGSNKPTIEEQNLVRHHLVDIIDSTVDRNMSSGEYVRLATVAIYDILSRGKTPIVVGGSTMWLEWLIHGVPDAPKATEEIISHVKVLLADYIDRSAWEEALLKCRVMFRDPTRADKLSTNDWYRLSRYLEVELTTNKTTIGSTQDLSSESSSLVEPSSEKTTSFSRNSTLTGLDVRCFFLSEEREELYRIIDTRCLDMLDRGLFEETTSLILDKHLEPDSMVARAIGYRQAIKYLCNPNRKMEEGTELEEFIKEFSSATRNYAKRQLQWYRRDDKFLWLQIFRSHIAQRPEKKQKYSSAYDRIEKEIQSKINSENLNTSDSTSLPTTSPYTTVTQELLYWLSKREADFQAMLSQQLECGDLVTRIRNSRGRTRGKTGQRKNKKQSFLQSVNDIETSPSVQDTNAGTHDISKLATEVQLFSQSRFYNVAIRSLVQSGELPESWLESLDNINMEDYKMTSLSALEPKIRASECQKSVKLLREYIQLVPKSVLSLTNTNTGTDTDVKPSLLQRADQCSLLLKSTENESLISEFYNAAK